MKKILLILAVAVSSLLAQSQNIEVGEFQKAFKPIIEASTHGYDTQSTSFNLPAATSTEYIVDESVGKTSFRAVYACTGRDASKKLKAHLAMHVESTLPAGDFKKVQGYGAQYFDYLKYTFEYNTDVYAETKKRPTIEIGALKVGKEYVVEVLISEPYFRDQYTPKWN
ncbi:MAG: hypothetical protein ACI84C_000089 [Flavobacteriales bacterium]|jgi:hypothetical protein